MIFIIFSYQTIDVYKSSVHNVLVLFESAADIETIKGWIRDRRLPQSGGASFRKRVGRLCHEF